MLSSKPPSVDVSKEVAVAVKALQPALAKLKRALALNPKAIAVAAAAQMLEHWAFRRAGIALADAAA